MKLKFVLFGILTLFGEMSMVQGSPIGRVVAWGYNAADQTTVPPDLSGAVAIATGYEHTVVLKSNGTVTAWGRNGEGQATVPIGLSGVTAVAAGYTHTAALKSNGTVVVWGGSAGTGQADVPVGLNGVTAISAGQSHTLALKSNGTVVAWGGNAYGQTTVPANLTSVVAVAGGGEHSVALKSNGTVVAWGHNDQGQTTIPAGLSGVTAIAAGFYNTVALKSNGTVVAWGSNGSGQTTIPAGLSSVTAIAAGYLHTVALKSNGTVVAWGSNGDGQTSVPVGLSGVAAIAAGAWHTVALSLSPTITEIMNQTTNEDVGTGFLPFNVGDAETSPGLLTVSGSSSNTTLVPTANIVFGGSGANRTVKVTPAANQNGSSTITVTVSDGTQTASAAFLLTVNLVNDAPTISNILDRAVNEDTNTGAISFTVGDVDNAVAGLTVSGTSSNSTLVPNESIVFGGSGASRTITVTPVANQFGTATITVTVSDGNLSAQDTFLLTVNPINDAPTMSDIVNRTIDEDTNTGAISFTVGDVDNAVAGLTVSGSSSNTVLVPDANIVLGGSGASRTVTVTPATNQKGTATITVVVSDGVLTTSDTFLLTVTGPEIEVQQTGAITNGGTQEFGNQPVGSQGQITFQIKNLGTKNLIITGISKNGPQAGDFTLGTLAATTLPPATSTPLAVTFVPTVVGYRTAALHISSNDSDEGSFEILLTGTASQPYAWSNFVGSPEAIGNSDGLGSAAGFAYAGGVAVDSNGNVYVADTNNHTIRKATPGGEVMTLAGLAGTPGTSDGNGSVARFNNPGGLTVDSNGNVFVADTNNHTIRKITSSGLVTTFAGSAGIIGSGDGPGNAARFSYPNAVAVDVDGTVFVADTNNHTIRKITAARAVSTLAGTAGSLGSTDATGSAARFHYPMGVAVDSAHQVFVADQYNHTIRKVTSAGEASTVAGSAGIAGAANGQGIAARFNYPAGVAVDTLGTLFVADTSNGTIRRLEASGWVSTIGSVAGAVGFVDGQGVNARFNNPAGIAVRAAGLLYVADLNNSRVSRGIAAPEIEVADALGTVMADGVSSMNFGNSGVGETIGLTFTIRNLGASDLMGFNVSTEGTNAGEFAPSQPALTTLPPGGSSTFTVNYTPLSLGYKTATLLITSNDADEGIFEIALLGNLSALEAWRKANFGSILNSGDGADLNDYDRDGLANLTEFAFGLNPKQNSAGQLPEGQIIGDNFVVYFDQPAGVSGITYGAEWSTTLLALSWTPIPDTGIAPQHTFSVPMGTNKRMFLRFKVSNP